MRGEVIGMNSQIATSTGDYNGIGFALPANETSFRLQTANRAGQSETRLSRHHAGISARRVRESLRHG
jgi:serine protease Do